MTTGEKIRKYRLERGLSQKELGLRAGMSEPAVRNYELGNRIPSVKRLEALAGALGVSRFALSDPDLDTYIGVMHALFYLEDTYGLEPIERSGEIVLKFPIENSHYEDVRSWCKERQAFAEDKISREDYDEWRHTFPKIRTERNIRAVRELQKKQK